MSKDMTDSEAAEFYYAHRDDPEPAGETVEVRVSRRLLRLSRVISVRFDPEEAAIIEQRAAEAGLTMSDYVRHVALSQNRHA
jgi:hypothetical protein